MKIYLSALLCTLSFQALGQEAKLEDFSRSTAPDRSVVERGRAAKLPPVQSPARAATDVHKAGQGLEATASRIVPAKPAFSVPAWMRRGHSLVIAAWPVGSELGAAPECHAGAYFQRPDLSGPAQLRRRLYFQDIRAAACEAGVPVRLFDALVAHESRYQPLARSPAGALGMAQLMPGTARYLGVSDPWDPAENLRGGARYLREQLDRYGSWSLALAAYNAGPGNVDKHGGIPPFPETRRYVRTILASLGRQASAPAILSIPVAGKPSRAARLLAFISPSSASGD